MEDQKIETGTQPAAGDTARERPAEEPKQKIFRQESLDRISSPEQLDNYIQVANPSVWIIIAAILFLLAGLLVWSALGTVETTVVDSFVSEKGVATGYLTDVSDLTPGMEARIGGAEGRITAISQLPYSSREVAQRFPDDYTQHMLGVEDWNYEITVTIPDLADGLYEGVIITGATKPISFIFN